MKPDNTLALDAYKRLLAQQEESERKARRKPKKPQHEESNIQRACVAWFRSKFPEREKILFAVPNGGGRSRIEAGIMKAEGVTAGVSDLILLEGHGGYGALCIELKTTDKGSRQRTSQQAWQKAAERAGNLYVVVRALEEFQAVVARYLALPRLGMVTIFPEDKATEQNSYKKSRI